MYLTSAIFEAPWSPMKLEASDNDISVLFIRKPWKLTNEIKGHGQ
jgi:hypothetical protein